MSKNGIKVKAINKLHYAEIVEPAAPNDLDWDDFRVFLEVVKYGSFNRAAVKLNMTQPTVSRRLIRLEKAIGVRLFERDRRGPRLTRDGRRVYNDANTAQAALSRATNQSNRPASHVDSDCKLLATDGIASYWVTRFLASFFQRHPDIEIKLFAGNVSSADKRTAFDLHIHYYEPEDSDLVATRVATMHFIPFGSREYLHEHGTPRSIEDLSRHRLLDIGINLADIGTWARLSQDEPSRRTAVVTNLSACIFEAVRQGTGIAVLPVYAPLVDDSVVPLEIGLHYQAPIYISYQRDAVKKWPVRATLDFLSTNVFDRKNMPWFTDDYIPLQSDWLERCTACVKRAAIPVIADRQLQGAY